MSPFEIKIMLHYYTFADDYNGPGNPEFIEKTLLGFVRQGLLKEQVRDPLCHPDDFNDGLPLHVITGKGQAYAEMLMEVPIPVQVWVDPRNIE